MPDVAQEGCSRRRDRLLAIVLRGRFRDANANYARLPFGRNSTHEMPLRPVFFDTTIVVTTDIPETISSRGGFV